MMKESYVVSGVFIRQVTIHNKHLSYRKPASVFLVVYTMYICNPVSSRTIS